MSDRAREDLAAGLAESDEVERLLSLAGRRSRLPENEVAPAREAARAAWRRGRARATRRRVGQVTALAASVVLVALVAHRERGFAPGPVRELAPLGELVVRSGEVVVTGASGATQRIGSDATIATGREGRAALELEGGASLRIDGSTFVRFESPTEVALDRGAVYLDVLPASARSAIAVKTPLGTVRHLGTQFEVRLLGGGDQTDPQTLVVSVREGSVRVERRGVVTEASAGSELTLHADGSIARSVAAVEGPAWDWTQQVAPEYRIEGRTLASYLTWVGRETGLLVRYADAEIEAIAGRTVLHGTIAGLTPEASLAVVLPGCGLAHTRAGASFTIEGAKAVATL
jgi:ferric-dicitrate binding protein FerR (iron transport regulator)